MDILRFITAGNVDDGKSTLIGRLLYDSKNIKDDILSSIHIGNNGITAINLAHITDGLRTERELGITIDVAYKYFTTKDRKYIITDAPGHFQYTKNLVTGASSVDVMIILVDAQNGITEQTRRHALVASLLRIENIVVVVNKMDICGYSESVFTTIENEFQDIANNLKFDKPTFIPISALEGDNIIFSSQNMMWYAGTTLMNYLETCKPVNCLSAKPLFSIQCKIAGDEDNLYAGKVLSGSFFKGDKVSDDSDRTCCIQKITKGYDEVDSAYAGDNICIHMDQAPGFGRGSLLSTDKMIKYNGKLRTKICWLSDKQNLSLGKEYILRINNNESKCTISEMISKVDINNLVESTDSRPLEVNEFATVTIEMADTIPFESFIENPEIGRGIIICPESYNTLAAITIM